MSNLARKRRRQLWAAVVAAPAPAMVCVLVALILASTRVTNGQVQDSLAQAKTLYEEAAYDDALAALSAHEAPEAYQYRALCYLALGRPQEAEGALETLVALAPGHTMAGADLPPKLMTLYAQTRARVLPRVAREIFASARADYQARQTARARASFEQALAILRDPALAAMPDASDLELLVTSYLEILPPPFPSASAPAKAPLPEGNARPAAAPTPLVAPAVPTTALAAPAVPPTALAASAPVRRRDVLPAVTLRQHVPAFTGTLERPLSGAVRITIGVDGRVTAAAIERPLDPRFDRRLLDAARTWRYQPATLDGVPIASEKVVEIRVKQ